MAFNLRNRHFLKLLDFTPGEVKFLLDLSLDLNCLLRSRCTRYLPWAYGLPTGNEGINERHRTCVGTYV